MISSAITVTRLSVLATLHLTGAGICSLHTKDMSEDDSSTLIILLETDNKFWTSGSSRSSGRQQAADTVEQILTFIRAFLLVSESNKVALFAVHNSASPLLYVSPGLHPEGSSVTHSPQFPAAEIKDRLATLWEQAGQDGGPVLAGALSRVLCFLHRRKPGQQHKARILCMQASSDVSSQYIAFMNAVFSAQRNDVVIDACMLGDTHSSLLQQASHLTGGIYTKPARQAALLQYLLAVYAGDSHTRSLLMLPQTHEVDFRASCFCHKRAIDLGYVCSVCLSIFCQSIQECSTCGTVFPAGDVGSKRKGPPTLPSTR